METKKVKKKRLSFKRVLILLLCLYLIGCFIYYLIKLPIKNIYIEGTNYINDVEIIEVTGIKNYPSLLNTKSSTLKKKISTIELVKSVEIKKNIFGKLTIIIEENKVLFYNRSKELLVLEDNSEVKFSSNYHGVPILTNYVLDRVYEELKTGLIKIDQDVLSLVSEIEYSPVIYNDIPIDETRFLFRMNDGNEVYVNTINIKNFNLYPKIYATLEAKGTLSMDSNNEENFPFRSYEDQELDEIEEKEVEQNEN